MAADYFHAGLTSDRKRDVQEAFRTGALRVIAATNAFGMGIDKPDIRLVVHGDIPGSLENYLQEAGRAGRGHILPRTARPDVSALPQTRLRYVSPDPKLMDLSFAGRLSTGHPTLASIAAAQPGDSVTLLRNGEHWEILDAQGRCLIRLSRAFSRPTGRRYLCGEVAAVLLWRKEDGHEDYHHLLRHNEWQVVLPELVFEPVHDVIGQMISGLFDAPS